MAKILAAVFFLLVLASGLDGVATAGDNLLLLGLGLGGGGGAAAPIGGALLLEDNASLFLLEDNASTLCFEGAAC